MKRINFFPIIQYVFSPSPYKKGMSLYSKKNYREAISFFQKAIKLAPNHPSSFFKLGVCYLKLREFNNAYTYIDQALSIAPKQLRWEKQLIQARTQLESQDSSASDSLLKYIEIMGLPIPRITMGSSRSFFSGKKKSLLLVPSAYNAKVMSDILPFVEFYKTKFQIYIILKDTDTAIINHRDYIVVENGSSFGEFLKFTADYVIDGGSLNYGYRITDKSKWVSVWHGIPYKKMFSDLNISHLASGIRYGLAYDVMISMSNFYTNTFLRRAMSYSGEIIEVGCAKADYFFKKNDKKTLKKALKFSENKKVILICFQEIKHDYYPLIDAIDSETDILLYCTGTSRIFLLDIATQEKVLLNHYIKARLNLEDLIFLSDFVISDDKNILRLALDNNLKTVDFSYSTDVAEEDSVVYRASANESFKEVPWKRLTSSLFEVERSVLKYKLGINSSTKIILYAPTFRKAGLIKLPFDSKLLLQSAGKDYIVIVKLHYLNSLEGEYPNVLDCSDYENISDLMKISDVLISDYSSLIIDYSLLKKPMVLYQYDFETYKSDRGVYFDLNDFVDESHIVVTEADLYKIDWNNLSNDTSKLVDEFYPYEQGNSTEKIVEKIEFNGELRKTKDIIFLVNELNQMGGIHGFLLNMAKYYKEKYNTRIFVLAIKEFAEANKDVYIFDDESIDFKLSSQYLSGACANILQNTDGIVISLQFSAHLHFQKYLKNANSILMFHGDVKDIISREIYGPHLDWLNNEILINYKKLLLLTKSNLDLLHPHLIEKVQSKLDYIPNSISNEYQLIPTNKDSSKNFAYIGRLDPDKNVYALIELGLHLKELNSDIVINIYGDGSLSLEVEELIKNNGLSAYLIMNGYISDKNKIFSCNEGLILMSKTEGLPLVILEAYSCGRPVIVFNTFTAAKDIVVDGETGYLINTDDYSSFVGALEKCNNISPIKIAEFFTNYSNDRVFNLWDQKIIDLYDN